MSLQELRALQKAQRGPGLTMELLEVVEAPRAPLSGPEEGFAASEEVEAWPAIQPPPEPDLVEPAWRHPNFDEIVFQGLNHNERIQLTPEEV